MSRELPALVRFSSSATPLFGVLVAKKRGRAELDDFASLTDPHSTFSDRKRVAKFCMGTEQEARRALEDLSADEFDYDFVEDCANG